MTLLLLNTTIKISLIVIVALTTMAVLRRRSAAVRHFVLAAALACAAATPALRLVAPAWQATAGTWFTTSRVVLIDRPLAVLEDSAPTAPSNGLRATTGGRWNTAALARSLGIIWIAGVGASLFVLLVGLFRLAWMASRASRITDGPWAYAAGDIARGYGLNRPPHPTLLGTWGFTRAKVLLPADAPQWPADRIRIVLGHELAHVRRRDWIVQVAAELLRSVYWFNPLLWLACRRLRIESEHACDDAVLTLGVEGSDYASELVDLARGFTSDWPRLMPAAAIARPSSLERRVRAMLNVHLDRDPITRTASIAAAVVLGVVTVFVAGFGASAQEQFATVSGSVVDQYTRPLNGARLVLSNAAAQTKSEVKSDAAGHYEFVGVPSGTYELMFEFTGMAYLKREGLTVAGGQAVQINGVMKIGSISETITVTPSINLPPPGGVPSARVNQVARVEKPDPCAASPTGGCLRPPLKIKDVRPIYPAGLAGPGGVVILEGRIDANGFVTGIEVLRTPDPALATAAVQAVNGWEFLPTHLDGQPIETRMTVTVNFAGAN